MSSNQDVFLDMHILMSSKHWIVPMAQWKYPDADKRWLYVKKCEEDVLKLASTILNWSQFTLTEGFCPSHDADVITADGKIRVEVKTTDRDKIFIECGREKDGVLETSGLVATTADAYIILSRHMVTTNESIHYVGKLRLIFTRDLQDLYARLAEAGREVRYPAGLYGPASFGIKFDPHELPHIWLGDLSCVVEHGITRYKISALRSQYKQQGRALKEFYQQLPKKVDHIGQASE